MFFVGEGLLFVNIKFVLGSELLSFTTLELSLRVSENVASILDLSSSEGVFRITFSPLSVVDLVVVDLFSINSVSEIVKDIEDSIKGALALELIFDFHHNVHDASLLTVVEGEFLS